MKKKLALFMAVVFPASFCWQDAQAPVLLRLKALGS